MSAEKRLLELGYALPEGPAPGGNYLSAKAAGGLLYLAGVISMDAGGVGDVMASSLMDDASRTGTKSITSPDLNRP